MFTNDIAVSFFSIFYPFQVLLEKYCPESCSCALGRTKCRKNKIPRNYPFLRRFRGVEYLM